MKVGPGAARAKTNNKNNVYEKQISQLLLDSY